MGQVLLGWYEIPTCLGAAINIVVNPGGAEERAQPRCVAYTLDPWLLVRNIPCGIVRRPPVFALNPSSTAIGESPLVGSHLLWLGNSIPSLSV